MRISETVPSASHKPTRGRLKLPIAISALASLWLWVGYVSSVKQKSIRLQQRIEESQSVLAGIHDQESRLRELERRLPVLEHELRTLSRMLWVAKGGGSLLPHIDRIARSAKVRIETFSAAPMGRGSGSLRYWKCDLKASFRPLLVFLRKMSSSERIVHIRSLTIRPASARNKSPRLLQLSLHLAAPTTEDNIR